MCDNLDLGDDGSDGNETKEQLSLQSRTDDVMMIKTDSS